jgi:hypothetical protein
VLEHDGQQGVTAPHAAWVLGVALADHSVPVDNRDGVAVAQFLRVAAVAWAAAKTQESADRALKRVRFLRLLERGASWAGVGWALNTSRQSAYERFTN